ncbi:hypothetical protein [Acidisphaera sp. L21]|uniref:hypothetical protein n=1 Tax=Acidisphaera sp. L21 TaxID=1641851 RepID=UPI00131ACDC3|nr:hypothetical protein [Acidisphaera sp. L21]
MRLFPLGILSLLLLSGCAAILEGTVQTITVRTAPIGASCTATRRGDVIAQIASTPAQIQFHRDGGDITVTCQKPGWDPTVSVFEANFNGVTFGNLIIGGEVGLIVDAASGANWAYDQDRTILMNPPTRTVAAVQSGFVAPQRPMAY